MYNDIGISDQLDKKRIRKLMIIGLISALITLVGDMLLGYGVSRSGTAGIEGYLSKYTDLSDTRIFLSALFGLIGIPLECLSYFGIYRLIASRSSQMAHRYRSGILGCLIFGACGVHVPCLACVFFYKHMMLHDPSAAVDLSIRFASYFLVPATVLFEVFFFYLCFIQIKAFRKGYTPYPEWCFIFNILFGMLMAFIPARIYPCALTNAISAGWISVGNIWMFMGLLMNMEKWRIVNDEIWSDRKICGICFQQYRIWIYQGNCS